MRLPALAGLLACLAAPVAAQDSTVVPRGGVPILLGSDTVFSIYAPAPPYTLEQRALSVAVTVQQAAGRAGPADSVHVATTQRGTYLMLGDATLLQVLPADAAAAGTTPAALADRWAAGLQAALATRRPGGGERSDLMRSVARAAVATAVALALAWALLRLMGRAERGLRAWSARRVRGLELVRARLVAPGQVLATAVTAARLLRLLALVTITYLWLVAVLGAFAWTAPMAGRVLRYATNPVVNMARAVVDYLPSLIFIVVVVAVLRVVLRFVRLFFRAIEQGTIQLEKFPAEWGDPTYKIVRALVVVFGLILIFPYLPGAGSDAFKAISLFAGALFSLGSSGAVANIVAGSVITYTRAFKVGDFVRIGETEGMVVERSLLVTRIRTVTNVDVSIPSATVLATHVQNFSAMAERRGLVIQSRVTIGYDAPWRTVHELLLRAAARADGVLPEPAPFVVQESLNDYYPVYCLNVYTDRATGMDVFRLRSRLNEHIQDSFFEGGVEILSPAYTSLRDGNRTAMPPKYLPPDYDAPGFKVSS
ncbi:MAG TPA: mechanosensitive ion channel domain-containing protein [Gemmatimonadales bacterium]|nr:mechanosensitive ion channel domain-containing protein [Gemmatimonadales bacterium]